MRKSLVGLVLALSTMSGAVLFGISPVQAAESKRDVPCSVAAMVCMWEDANYGGSMYVIERNWKLGVCYEIDGWDGDDEISSARNSTFYTLILRDGDCGEGGEEKYIRGRDDMSNLKNFNFNDRAESWMLKA